MIWDQEIKSFPVLESHGVQMLYKGDIDIGQTSHIRQNTHGFENQRISGAHLLLIFFFYLLFYSSIKAKHICRGKKML